MKKRWKSLFVLTVFCLFGMANGTMSKVHAETYGEWSYSVLEDGTAEITGYSGTGEQLTIPSSINGVKVTSVGKRAFWGSGFKKVIFQQGITTIKPQAFILSEDLESVVIPNSVVSIGDGAFSGTNLAEIDIPSSVTDFGSSVLANTPWETELRKTNEPIIVNNIVISATHCTGELEIADGVKEIAPCAFGDDSREATITKITLPESVTKIGRGAFQSCVDLKEVEILGNVEVIEDYTFAFCSCLNKITLPASVESISDTAFSYAYEGMVVVAPEDSYAANWATENGYTKQIASVGTEISMFEFSARVTSADENNLTVEWVDGNYSKNYTSVVYKGYTYKITSIAENAFQDISASELNIPVGVVSIGAGAYKNCADLTSVTIPSSVKNIGADAFSNCGQLSSIEIPSSVTSIGEGTFANCAEDFVIIAAPGSYAATWAEANSISTIGCMHEEWNCEITTNPTCKAKGVKTYTCAACGETKTESIDMLKHIWNEGVVTKAATATETGTKEFTCTLCGDTRTDSIPATGQDTEGEDTSDKNTSDGNTTPTPDDVATSPKKKGTSLTVKNTKSVVKVTSSNAKSPTVAYVKSTDKKAKKVTIPDTVTVDGVTYKVTSIADNAFKGNKYATTVTIGKNVTSIGKNAFKNSKKLTTVTIGKNVTTIGKEAFKNCKKLKKITVTAGKLKTIGKNAFKSIDKKATIKVKGTKKAKKTLIKKLKNKKTGYVKTWKIK